MKRGEVKAVLPVDHLQGTNDWLHEPAVQDYQRVIREEGPSALGLLFIRLIPGLGYFVNNGNHRREALRREGVSGIECEVYKID